MTIGHTRAHSLCGLLGSMLISTFLMFGATAAPAQVVRPSADALSELDRRIESYLEEYNIPGGLIAVTSRGRIIHLKAYGLANVELSVPVTDSTVFLGHVTPGRDRP